MHIGHLLQSGLSDYNDLLHFTLWVQWQLICTILYTAVHYPIIHCPRWWTRVASGSRLCCRSISLPVL